jgi:uncharacterized protein YaaW (UPF0174 family)
VKKNHGDRKRSYRKIVVDQKIKKKINQDQKKKTSRMNEMTLSNLMANK